jgi:hypothetical protein
MRHAYKNLVLGLTISSIVGITGYLLYKISLPTNRKYRAAFSQVAFGDSGEKVVSLFGEPQQLTDCHYITGSHSKEETKDKCVEIAWYYGFLEEWALAYDKDGNVIRRLYLISG